MEETKKRPVYSDIECDCDIDCFGKVKAKARLKSKTERIESTNDSKEVKQEDPKN